MSRGTRKRRRDMARHHQVAQAAAKTEALVESVEASRRAKKGSKGVVAQMEKRGYVPDGAGWRRLPRPVAA
jgi:hypothetical protein